MEESRSEARRSKRYCLRQNARRCALVIMDQEMQISTGGPPLDLSSCSAARKFTSYALMVTLLHLTIERNISFYMVDGRFSCGRRAVRL